MTIQVTPAEQALSALFAGHDVTICGRTFAMNDGRIFQVAKVDPVLGAGDDHPVRRVLQRIELSLNGFLRLCDGKDPAQPCEPMSAQDGIAKITVHAVADQNQLELAIA